MTDFAPPKLPDIPEVIAAREVSPPLVRACDCGNEKLAIVVERGDVRPLLRFYVGCLECSACGKPIEGEDVEKTQAHAITLWNSRGGC